MLEDRADLGYEELYNATQALLGQMFQTPGMAFAYSNYTINVPQLYADIDRVKAKQQGIALGDVFETLQTYLGSTYVNDFNRFGRTYRVIAQADAQLSRRARRHRQPAHAQQPGADGAARRAAHAYTRATDRIACSTTTVTRPPTSTA